jgi:hypothetical protein
VDEAARITANNIVKHLAERCVSGSEIRLDTSDFIKYLHHPQSKLGCLVLEESSESQFRKLPTIPLRVRSAIRSEIRPDPG